MGKICAWSSRTTRLPFPFPVLSPSALASSATVLMRSMYSGLDYVCERGSSLNVNTDSVRDDTQNNIDQPANKCKQASKQGKGSYLHFECAVAAYAGGGAGRAACRCKCILLRA
jgi:hypothetical protein